MFRSLSAVALLALSALAALPAEAGDRRDDHRFPGHRHDFHGGLFLGERIGWRDRGIRFDNAYRYRNRKERMPFLKQFSSPATNRIARNNLIVVLPQTQGGDGGGTYAGSSYVYQVDGGTYVGGNGYGYPTARPELLAPKAKVIDIAVRDDPCSYEANVCVIRP
ncbi:hypothetical protein HFO94_06380 [Rhizobium leguminosarum]|uniref:hypothetical protein n=1 Tax=Rhizobium TaxID=379 RepID=UPI0014792C22|nr:MULTISPECIES: hypothetical protein [Rhizobium]MBY5353171.1 hypothetical protein [Rhizobium leguminosarum]NNH43587.1 hypothetical protein [Rhizobium laguerreae]